MPDNNSRPGGKPGRHHPNAQRDGGAGERRGPGRVDFRDHARPDRRNRDRIDFRGNAGPERPERRGQDRADFRRNARAGETLSARKQNLTPQVTTLWDFPSQNYGSGKQGDINYAGATPSYIIWNLLMRYTREKWLVVDPMCGSGTTLDVARDLNRRALGYDLQPTRPDIFHNDARKLPLENEKVDFVFIDPPYSDHLTYSGDERCIGELSAATPAYYESMEKVIKEIHRVLRPDRYMGLYVSDSFVKNKGFFPIGFELFNIMKRYFTPVDIISVVRHNKTLQMGNYRKAADEGNFFLRGFNYLFIMHKERKTARPE